MRCGQFEYQSYNAELTAWRRENSSNYDPHRPGEAASLCHRINERRKFLSRGAQRRQEGRLHNYVKGLGMQVVEYASIP
jgi:glycine cleavage system pyridoxal-binding protein P